jgi:hypothetical protein
MIHRTGCSPILVNRLNCHVKEQAQAACSFYTKDVATIISADSY